jgi:hypothetical protein
LQVSDYGIRIGFVRDDLSVPVSVYTPSITPLYNPNSSNLFDPVRYFKVTRDGFELPLFTNFDVDGANHYYLDFANDGVAEPSSPITNVYEYFWKDYIATMFGKNSYEGSFVFDLETGLLLSPTQLYDFGRGDCFITGFDSLNLFEKRSKVLLKLRQYG